MVEDKLSQQKKEKRCKWKMAEDKLSRQKKEKIKIL